jgi:hypothetical protein
MRRIVMAAALAAAVVGAFGRGDYGGSSASAPTGSTTSPPNAIVINVIAENGAQSFSPKPANGAGPSASRVAQRRYDDAPGGARQRSDRHGHHRGPTRPSAGWLPCDDSTSDTREFLRNILWAPSVRQQRVRCFKFQAT